MKELKDVFEDPNDAQGRYAYAKLQYLSFAEVKDKPGNYRALIAAYADAGCDVCARWAAYLRKLGSTPAGQNDIFQIAQARLEALQVNRPMKTKTHDHAHGGDRADVHRGNATNPADPTIIDAPFEPAP